MVVGSGPAGLAAALGAAREGVKTMLVAGRCVAGDKISHAAIRSMMCCTVTGQGALKKQRVRVF